MQGERCIQHDGSLEPTISNALEGEAHYPI